MPNNIIDSIQVSGVTYAIQGGSGNPTVELTQAEYNALVESGAVQTNTYYIITDAQPADISQYWTSAQTQSAITAATSGKVDTTAITSSVTSASTDAQIPTAKAVYDAVGSGGVTVDSAFSRTSENPVQNKVISNNATNGDGTISNTSGIYKWEFYSVGGVGTNKGFYLDTINGETVVKKYNNTRSLQLVETSAITTSMSSSSTDSQVPSAKAVYDQFGGLKLVKLTQSAYDALSPNYDSNTLYVIVN